MLNITFVNNGSDDGLLKSMAVDEFHEYNQEELEKAMDRSGLVQREITVRTKHGVHTRKQWVRASDVKKPNKPTKAQDDADERKRKYAEAYSKPVNLYDYEGTDKYAAALVQFKIAKQLKRTGMEPTEENVRQVADTIHTIPIDSGQRGYPAKLSAEIFDIAERVANGTEIWNPTKAQDDGKTDKASKDSPQPKITSKSILDMVLTEPVKLDSDGRCKFVVTKVNTENFKDLPDGLVKQLKDSGKYGSYVGFITSKPEPYSFDVLPVFGSSSQWVTKWFRNSPEEAAKDIIKDRGMKVVKRANDYVNSTNKTADTQPQAQDDKDAVVHTVSAEQMDKLKKIHSKYESHIDVRPDARHETIAVESVFDVLGVEDYDADPKSISINSEQISKLREINSDRERRAERWANIDSTSTRTRSYEREVIAYHKALKAIGVYDEVTKPQDDPNGSNTPDTTPAVDPTPTAQPQATPAGSPDKAVYDAIDTAYATGEVTDLVAALQNSSVKTISTGNSVYTHDVDHGIYVNASGTSEFSYKKMANKLKRRAIGGRTDFKVTA